MEYNGELQWKCCILEVMKYLFEFVFTEYLVPSITHSRNAVGKMSASLAKKNNVSIVLPWLQLYDYVIESYSCCHDAIILRDLGSCSHG